MCGVFGVFAPGQPVAHLTYLGLYALQHRGQESAGMAVADDDASLTVVKDMGLVSNVFDDRTLAALSGHPPSATPATARRARRTWRNAQPVYRDVGRPRVRPGPQRQPHQHRGAGRRRRDAARASCRQRQRPHRRAAGPAHGGHRRATSSTRWPPCCRGSTGPTRWCCWTTSPDHRRPRPERLPAAVPRPARRRLGAGRRRRRRSTSSAPSFVRELEPGEIVVIDADGPRTVRVVPGRAP